jgi:hypothetical protein
LIKIYAEDVLTRFSMLCGTEESDTYQMLCCDTAAEIELAERADCSEDGRAVLTAAAAALAFYRYVLSAAGTGEKSFCAGDVKVTAAAASPESARKLWKGAADTAAPFLKDSGCFLFGRIGP